MKILTLYDGSLPSKTALQYGLLKANEKGGEVIVLQVFQSSLFVDYDAPKAEEFARAEAASHLRDAESLIHERGHGVAVRIVSVEGDPKEETLHFAKSEHVDLILTAPRYRAIAKKASCPVYVMPGTILVPVDNSEALLSDIDSIVAEANITGSKVLLLGVVPVHLYGAEEKKELGLVRKETVAAIKKTADVLRERDLDVSQAVRSGYPDEEILKAAEEYAISLIMLPAGGKTPSELTKAASILLDEPERVRMPILLLQGVG